MRTNKLILAYLIIFGPFIMLASSIVRTIVRSKVASRSVPLLTVSRGFAGSNGGRSQQQTDSSLRLFAASGVVAAALAAGVSTQSTQSSCETGKCPKSADKFANTAMYPPIQPYEKGMLKVSDIHTIAYSVYGNPKGKPVLVVHGGPGGGTTPGKNFTRV